MSYGMPFRVYLILQPVLQIRPQGMSYGMPFRVYLILQPVLLNQGIYYGVPE